jgi:hypothetical protein
MKLQYWPVGAEEPVDIEADTIKVFLPEECDDGSDDLERCINVTHEGVIVDIINTEGEVDCTNCWGHLDMLDPGDPPQPISMSPFDTVEIKLLHEDPDDGSRMLMGSMRGRRLDIPAMQDNLYENLWDPRLPGSAVYTTDVTEDDEEDELHIDADGCLADNDGDAEVN